MNYSTEWAQARAEHEIAYAAHDALAEAGDDNSPEALAASEREYETLFRALKMPAITPSDVSGKLLMIEERDINSGWSDHWPAILDRIHRDIAEMSRPSVSPRFAERFDVWRKAHRQHYDDTAGDDGSLCEASAEAFRLVMMAPCVTPGDFIAKAYMEALIEHGPTFLGEDNPDKGQFCFEIDWSALHGEAGDWNSHSASVIRDLAGCDLGRCLIALGRVDFDAAGWIDAAHRARLAPIVIDEGGKRGLFVGYPDGTSPADTKDELRQEIVEALLKDGYGDERRRAVAAYIEASRPDLIYRAPAQEMAA